MIAGVVVVYNPKNDILENIKSYLGELEELYIIDNSDTQNIINIEDNPKIKYIKNNSNLGIAKGLNLGIELALKNLKIKYLLTMDQDSSFSNQDFKKFVSQVLKDKDKNIVIYSPIHLMGNIKINSKRSSKQLVMTSGNILNLENLEKVGYFLEDFFIDEVDHEFCYRIYEKKMEIKIYENIFLNHQLGERKEVNKVIGTNHNPIRRYYITRNKLYMIKKYPFLKNEYSLQIMISLIRIIFFENQKKNKIRFLIKGIIDYKNGKVGRLKQ